MSLLKPVVTGKYETTQVEIIQRAAIGCPQEKWCLQREMGANQHCSLVRLEFFDFNRRRMIRRCVSHFKLMRVSNCAAWSRSGILCLTLPPERSYDLPSSPFYSVRITSLLTAEGTIATEHADIYEHQLISLPSFKD